VGNTSAGSTKLERLVFVEQTQSLYAKGRIALGVNLVNSVILVAALWPSVSHQIALAWLLAVYLTVGLRFVLVGLHRRAEPRTYAAPLWNRRWTISTALTGALWGAAGVLLYSADSPSGQHLLLFVIGGMIAGASSSMSSYWPTFLAFTLPALAPPIVRLIIERERSHLAMAALLAIFGLGMTALAREGARTLAESIRLRLRNMELSSDLSALHEQLMHLGSELEGRVAARTKDLEQAMRARDSFVSIVSHELRSPLSSMTLGQELLQKRVERETIDLPQLRKSVGQLSRQLDRMRHIVDDLFDVTRLSTDQMTYEMAPVTLAEIVESTVEEMSSQQSFRRAAFDVHLEEGLRGRFDRWRIQQVLVNVIGNALKYGAPPYSLIARRVGERIEIAIHDSGPGIPPEQARRIFEAFQRGPSAGAPGLGVGLYVSERIVSAHGGTIRVDSRPGQGATFTITLPRAPAELGDREGTNSGGFRDAERPGASPPR
jgi:signal transduction histidine kinase